MTNGVLGMGSGQRGTRMMLGVLGAAVFFVVLGGLAGTVSPAIALTAGIAYTLIAIVALSNLRPNLLRDRLQEIGPAVTIANRTTPVARRAAQRARNRGEFSLEVNLLDIGMMVNERRRNGQLDRHLAGESVSMDSAAVQPFVKIHLNPGTAERLALLEFEYYDQAGKVRFSHQQKHWVRDGENLIACEQQLPLRGNDELGRAGTWDLRVKVDGTLAGVYGFSMLASQETGRRLAEDEAVEPRRDRMTISSPDENDAPISLEELLSEQKRRSSSH